MMHQVGALNSTDFCWVRVHHTTRTKHQRKVFPSTSSIKYTWKRQQAQQMFDNLCISFSLFSGRITYPTWRKAFLGRLPRVLSHVQSWQRHWLRDCGATASNSGVNPRSDGIGWRDMCPSWFGWPPAHQIDQETHEHSWCTVSARTLALYLKKSHPTSFRMKIVYLLLITPDRTSIHTPNDTQSLHVSTVSVSSCLGAVVWLLQHNSLSFRRVMAISTI